VPASSAIHALSLHDALPICVGPSGSMRGQLIARPVHHTATASQMPALQSHDFLTPLLYRGAAVSSLMILASHGSTQLNRVRSEKDRKSTRLNSSHVSISYAV